MTPELEAKINEAALKEHIYEPKYGGKDHSGYDTLMKYEVNDEREEAFTNGAKWAIDTILPDVLSWMQNVGLDTWEKWKEYNYQPGDIMKEYFEYLKTHK